MAEPVPFAIYTPGCEPDAVERFDEASCAAGAYGTLRLMGSCASSCANNEFMRE